MEGHYLKALFHLQIYVKLIFTLGVLLHDICILSAKGNMYTHF